MAEQYIYGIHAVLMALKVDEDQIKQLYVLQGRNDKRIQAALTLASKLRINIIHLSRQELDTLVDGANHQGVIASMKHHHPQLTEDDIMPFIQQLAHDPLILILDGIQDPHNLGACLRSADGAGVDLVIAPKDGASHLTPTVRKVACGAAETIPFVAVTNIVRVIKALKAQGIWIYGLAQAGQTNLHHQDLTGPVALALGNEGKGLRRLTQAHCDVLLSIPMRGGVSSLNISVATGVCLYEALRQRAYSTSQKG